MSNKDAETTDSKGLFHEIVNMSNEEEKRREAAFTERRLKRELASAFDDAERKVYEARRSLDSHRMCLKHDPEKYSVNTACGFKATIRKYEIAAQRVKEEYLVLFGEEIG